MSIWEGILWVAGFILAVMAVWGVLGFAIDKLFHMDGDGYGYAGGILAAVATVLLIGWAVAAVANSEPDDRGRCGPGTKMVVEQIWTGKVYVTDFVCVVDLPA